MPPVFPDQLAEFEPIHFLAVARVLAFGQAESATATRKLRATQSPQITSVETIFPIFVHFLNQRIDREHRFKEDELRYTFFHALIQSGIYRHIDIRLETPHPNPALQDKEIDLVLCRRGSQPGRAVEFKLDQKPPGGGATNVTARAGKFLNDMARLSCATLEHVDQKLLVYATDQKMHGYLGRERNGFTTLYGATDSFLVNRPFRENLKKTSKAQLQVEADFNARLLFASVLNRGFFVRVFEITDCNPSRT